MCTFCAYLRSPYYPKILPDLRYLKSIYQCDFSIAKTWAAKSKCEDAAPANVLIDRHPIDAILSANSIPLEVLSTLRNARLQRPVCKRLLKKGTVNKHS